MGIHPFKLAPSSEDSPSWHCTQADMPTFSAKVPGAQNAQTRFRTALPNRPLGPEYFQLDFKDFRSLGSDVTVVDVFPFTTFTYLNLIQGAFCAAPGSSLCCVTPAAVETSSGTQSTGLSIQTRIALDQGAGHRGTNWTKTWGNASYALGFS